jgi:hypothetical protein
MCWQEVWLLEIEGLGGDLSFWKTKKARTCLFGNPEYTKGDTDGVGLRCFYLLWWLDLKPKALSLCNSNSLGFFSRGAPKQKWKVPAINAQSLSKEAEQKSIKTSCLGCPRVTSTAQRATFKIILHRIISVVWLTNFLSEIRSLSNHDDETQFRILSVKPFRGFSSSEHWWSLTALYWVVMDEKQSEWPIFTWHVYLHLSSTCMATQGGAVSQLLRVCYQFLLT